MSEERIKTKAYEVGQKPLCQKCGEFFVDQWLLPNQFLSIERYSFLGLCVKGHYEYFVVLLVNNTKKESENQV